ncbi:MAG TPA: HAMP domain-containing protein, partial [Casimicrobiaceae bacterium]|nr:HAMP domain-containing protein [Casimicrobiaceae bacterium]
KVADFGICRINETEQTQKADQTQMGAVLGTPNYMSPEQVQGLSVDARSDLFSAGVVLYQMLTGHLPFEADSMISVVYKIANTDAPSLDKLRPDLPLSLRRVIARALKKTPDKRYQSGEAFAQALIGVAREMDEEARRKGKARVIPLSIRWALTMAALVAVTMSITATILYQRQYASMLDQATGYGGSLAKLVAVQTAVPLLGEDWAGIDVFIQETQSRQEFPYLLVVDHRGVIRGSNDAAQVGTTYKPPESVTMPAHDPGVTVKSYRLPDRRAVLDFDTPVLFQSKELGRVHLGLYEAPLKKIANLMLVLLAILTVVTSAAVAGGTYFLAHRLAAPIRVLRNSLKELASGHYDYRIADKRNDEFGELYSDFDQTAEALEKRHEADAAAAQTKS